MTNKLLCIVAFSALVSSCGTLKNPKETKVFSAADYPYVEKFHEGIRLKQRGNFKEAIAAFEACREMKPNDDAVHYALSELYLQTQQLSKSMEAIQSAARIDPNNQWYKEELAYMYYQKENFAEAAKQFEKLVQKEPRNVDWLFSYAESLMRSNDSQGAIKVLDKLEEQVGVNPQLSIEKFRLYGRIKQEDKAVEEINKALKVFPQDPELLANLVDFYFAKKQDQKAYDYLIKLTEADPDNGNAQLVMARYYDQKGDRKASYGALKKAFASDEIPLDKKMQILISMYDSQFKLDPEMFELSDILLTKYPEDAKVYAIRGDFYMKSEQPEEALIAFQKALEFDQSRYAIWDQVLIMEYQNQDFEKLYADSKRCLELFPSLVNVYLFHGIAANQTKRHNEAIEALSIAEDLVVNDNGMKAEILSQKGQAYFGLKEYAEGKKNYEEALKLMPNQLFILNNYAYYLALAKTDLDKAESMIQKVLVAAPTDSRYLDTYGWILFQKGKYADAKASFEAALKQKQTDKLIYEHLGDASFKLGKVNEAVEYWKKAKEMGATNKALDKKIEKKEYYEPIY